MNVVCYSVVELWIDFLCKKGTEYLETIGVRYVLFTSPVSVKIKFFRNQIIGLKFHEAEKCCTLHVAHFG